jgi:hypothetical protein
LFTVYQARTSTERESPFLIYFFCVTTQFGEMKIDTIFAASFLSLSATASLQKRLTWDVKKKSK